MHLSLKKNIVDIMKLNPFSIAVDGSNDAGQAKMNPLTVRIFDCDQSRIVTRFLDMCTCEFGMVDVALTDQSLICRGG